MAVVDCKYIGKSIEDLGCVANDPNFADNATLINEALEAMQDKKLTVPLHVPGKQFFITEPIIFPPTTGQAMFGNGMSYILGEWEYEAGVGGPVSRFTWIGEEDQPMIRLQGLGTRLEGLALQGRRIPESAFTGTGPNASYGILIEGRPGGGLNPPTGKHNFSCLTFVQLGVGICFSNEPNEEHADECTCHHLEMNFVDVGYQVLNQQSVPHYVTGLHFTPSSANAIVFDFDRGGCLVASSVTINNKGTLLRTNNLSQNTSRFDITGIRVDTNVGENQEFALLEMLNDGNIMTCTMQGLIARLPGTYDHRLIVPRGNQYDIRLDMTGIPASYRKAYPMIGVRSDDTVLSETPPTTDLKLWLSPTDGSTVRNSSAPASDGEAVDEVLDRSSSGNTVIQMQTSPTNLQPAYVLDGLHRRPALHFDATDLLAKSGPSGVSNIPGLTVVAIVRENNHNPGAPNVIAAVDQFTGQRAWNLNITAGGKAQLFVTNTSLTSDEDVIQRRPNLILARYNSSGAWLIEVNGQPKTNTSGGGNVASSTAALTVGGLYHGGGTNAQLFFGGYMGDVAIYNAAVNDTVLQWWREYALAKYGCPVYFENVEP